ncbi:unnamed protein product [Mytilus edulis]|uniref:Uncharacterized protein n=1 Tax=Mytilus edulis TaxID=6550 RepID=A0A8S3UC86_MYTED|nr:unnamed protein product [Mytilus edulis]
MSNVKLTSIENENRSLTTQLNDKIEELTRMKQTVNELAAHEEMSIKLSNEKYQLEKEMSNIETKLEQMATKVQDTSQLKKENDMLYDSIESLKGQIQDKDEKIQRRHLEYETILSELATQQSDNRKILKIAKRNLTENDEVSTQESCSESSDDCSVRGNKKVLKTSEEGIVLSNKDKLRKSMTLRKDSNKEMEIDNVNISANDVHIENSNLINDLSDCNIFSGQQYNVINLCTNDYNTIDITPSNIPVGSNTCTDEIYDQINMIFDVNVEIENANILDDENPNALSSESLDLSHAKATNIQNINLIYINCCGLKHKLQYPEFETLLQKHEILCFVESKTDDMDEICIPGYKIKAKNRRKISRVKSGGIVLGFRENISDCIQVIETNSKFVLWCKISRLFKDGVVILGVVYIPPEYTAYSSPDDF